MSFADTKVRGSARVQTHSLYPRIQSPRCSRTITLSPSHKSSPFLICPEWKFPFDTPNSLILSWNFSKKNFQKFFVTLNFYFGKEQLSPAGLKYVWQPYWYNRENNNNYGVWPLIRSNIYLIANQRQKD